MLRRQFLGLLGLIGCKDEDMFLAQSGIMGFSERIPVDIPYTSYTPTFAGFSVAPTVVARYVNYGGLVHLWITTTVHGTSNATAANSLTFTLPLTAVTGPVQNCEVAVTVNNGARSTAPGLCTIASGATTGTVYRDSTVATTWTGSGNKSFNLSIIYEVANYTTFVPSFAGFSADPTVTARYIHQFGRCHYHVGTTAHGTSNTTSSNSTTISLPVQSAPFDQRCPCAVIVDNGSRQSGIGELFIAANSTTAIVYRNPSEGTNWTGSGNKSFNFSVLYETV